MLGKIKVENLKKEAKEKEDECEKVTKEKALSKINDIKENINLGAYSGESLIQDLEELETLVSHSKKEMFNVSLSWFRSALKHLEIALEERNGFLLAEELSKEDYENMEDAINTLDAIYRKLQV